MRVLSLFFLFQINLAHAQYVHSHNDYKKANPFTDAYSSNAFSIEVDIFLRDSSLFVAHESSEIDQSKTLAKLYLQAMLNSQPLRQTQLLIDIKTEAKSTLEVLIKELEKYPNLIHNKQIRFVISGNRPNFSEYHLYPDFIFFDHQKLEKIGDADLKKIALFSFPFRNFSLWNGVEELTSKDSERLLKTIQQVHELGHEIRFWGTPDTPLAWSTFQEMNLDYINTDKPKACYIFLNQKKQ